MEREEIINMLFDVVIFGIGIIMGYLITIISK